MKLSLDISVNHTGNKIIKGIKKIELGTFDGEYWMKSCSGDFENITSEAFEGVGESKGLKKTRK